MKREGKGRGEEREVNGHLHGNGKGRKIEGKEESDAMGIGDGGVGKIGIENKRYYERGRLASRGMGREGKMT